MDSQPSSRVESSFFHRLDVRFPWLKLLAVCLLGFFVILDLLDLTISKVTDPYDKIRIAPMAHHVRITKRVLEGKKLVALTFDDGPSSTTTPALLDILFQEDVPATFFMLGHMARNNPELVRQVEAAGHVVASHTMYHQNLVRLSATAVQADIDEANATFNEILGHGVSLTRPPYGNINSNVRAAVGTPMILWSVDTLDWQSKNPDAIIETTLSQVHDGAVILMHDIHPTTIAAVPTLIKVLRDSGYEFVTILELAKIRGVELVNGTAYYNFQP